jgi:SAM-dependent methyltransferase
MDEFRIDKCVFPFKKNGWWSRVYEYRWMKDVNEVYFGSSENKSAIDVATGDQHPGMFILESVGFSRVVGTDLFPKQKYRYSLKSNMEYVCDDIVHSKIIEKFDSVNCISVLEHIDPELQSLALENMIRMVKSGGIIVLTFDMPGFEYKTNLDLYKEILRKNGMSFLEKNADNILTTRNYNGNIDSVLVDKNLSCYRIVAEKKI